MSTRKALRALLIIIFFLFFGSNVRYVYPIDDGFGPANKIEGKHFTIYYAPRLDVFTLVKQLNIGLSDKVLAGESIENSDNSNTELASMVDTLFLRVCDILDMNLFSFRGNIKIARDQEQLNGIYSNLFNKDLNSWHSFYVYDLNTIYISANDFKREILGHEIGHAVISHYFVVLPSVKVQEVLATYVEYQLRKSLSQ
ncbi:MAG: hypothetical protein WC723_07000 [Candidatus Omnitrophota bacterium]